MNEGEQHWILKALREAAEELIGQFYGLSEEELRWRPLADEWSLKEIAAHLRDSEELHLRQIRLIAGEEEPALPTLDLEALPLEQDYQALDIHEVLAAFGRLRSQTSLVLWGLSPWDWERCGHHPYRGPVTIAQIARELAEHDLGHLWQIRCLKGLLAEKESPSP